MFNLENNDIQITIKVLNDIFLILFTCYTNIKIRNYKIKYSFKLVIKTIMIIIASIILGIMRNKISFLVNEICLIIIVSMFFSLDNFFSSIITTILSLNINYLFRVLSIIICFLINKIKNSENNYANFIAITIIHLIFINNLFRIRKIKYGFNFLKRESSNENFDILTINISMIVLFAITILTSYDLKLIKNMFVPSILFGIFSIIVIQKNIKLYYKQKLLIQDLNETKKELEDKEKEIQILEQENLNFSKKSHSLAHKQKVLEHKINKLLLKTECAEEFDLKDRVEDISKELVEDAECGYINKTGISNIDDVLETMQEECRKNNIEFNVQIYGNIFKMVNNYIEKDDLEILLADHIKDAIIAVNHSDNVNRSILIKLGKIDNCYGIYFYDSGVEFDKKVLENLGKKPVTAYSKEGGTGIGFMNTFDTLRKYNASLKINHLGKPCKENFTKIIMIKFDKNTNFCLTN